MTLNETIKKMKKELATMYDNEEGLGSSAWWVSPRTVETCIKGWMREANKAEDDD